jgi:hypothetical protein
MKKSCLLFGLLSCLIVFAFVSSVSAQLPHFIPNFDRIDYVLGSTGTVTFDIETFDQAFDISMMGVTLYFTITDGRIFETEFFGENYGETPFQIAAHANVSVSFDFTIPQIDDLASGFFYYIFEMDIRVQNTTTYYHESSELQQALYYEYPCILQGPQSSPLPTPIIEPTPTPVRTPSPTPTPTPTPSPTPTPTPTPLGVFLPIEVLFGIGVIIIVVIIVIILVMLRNRRK